MLKRIAVGKVGKSHGIKGEMKIIPYTDDKKRFDKLKKVFIEDKEYKVEGVKYQAERVILKLEGFDTPEELIVIRDKDVEINIEDAVKKKKDEYFIFELKGLDVFDLEGVFLGKIHDVLETGSNDVYYIREPKEILIPALKTVIKEVNLEEGRMVIAPLKEWNYED